MSGVFVVVYVCVRFSLCPGVFVVVYVYVRFSLCPGVFVVVYVYVRFSLCPVVFVDVYVLDSLNAQEYLTLPDKKSTTNSGPWPTRILMYLSCASQWLIRIL